MLSTKNDVQYHVGPTCPICGLRLQEKSSETQEEDQHGRIWQSRLALPFVFVTTICYCNLVPRAN